MRKARRSASVPLSVKLPPKRVREEFLITYELEGCQKAVNYLTQYYSARKMKICLNGRKVGKDYLGFYIGNRAYLKKKGLNRKTVLHELYHHLVETRKLEIPQRTEEKEANSYSRAFERFVSEA
jgi:hypothetical protein